MGGLVYYNNDKILGEVISKGRGKGYIVRVYYPGLQDCLQRFVDTRESRMGTNNLIEFDERSFSFTGFWHFIGRKYKDVSVELAERPSEMELPQEQSQ